MAVKSARVTVTDTATRLDANQTDFDSTSAITVRNRGTVSVDLDGDNSVTSGNGFELEPGDTYSVDLNGRDEHLYAIAATGQTARVDRIQEGI